MPRDATMVDEGGIMLPRQLEALVMFAASSGEKPDFFMAGMVIVPVAIPFPGPEPERAPIKLDATTVTYPAPPVTRPRRARIISIAPSIIFVFVRMMDMATNTVME